MSVRARTSTGAVDPAAVYLNALAGIEALLARVDALPDHADPDLAMDHTWLGAFRRSLATDKAAWESSGTVDRHLRGYSSAGSVSDPLPWTTWGVASGVAPWVDAAFHIMRQAAYGAALALRDGLPAPDYREQFTAINRVYLYADLCGACGEVFAAGRAVEELAARAHAVTVGLGCLRAGRVEEYLAQVFAPPADRVLALSGLLEEQGIQVGRTRMRGRPCPDCGAIAWRGPLLRGVATAKGARFSVA